MLLDVWDDHLLETAGRSWKKTPWKTPQLIMLQQRLQEGAKWLGIRSSEGLMSICVQCSVVVLASASVM